MIALKAVLLGIGFSVFGTIIYLVLYFRWIYQSARQTVPTGTGSIGFDIVSQAHNTIYTPAYCLFVVGLFATGCAIVFLWPGPVVN